MADETAEQRESVTRRIKWRGLASDLRTQIENGDLVSGGPVPSITRLNAAGRGARQTCGRALQALEDEGLLVRLPGKGYFVL